MAAAVAASTGHMASSRRSKAAAWFAVMVAALLLVAPAVSGLNVATRSIKARPSAQYSPDTAWESGFYGCGVTVAVFDEGVDDEHPYLDGKVAGGVDTTATGDLWQAANDGNPQPILGSHGTPVAGIAVSHAGQPFFDPGDKPDYDEDALVGVAPCAYMVDVMFYDVMSDDGFESDVVEAFRWAIDHRNASWGDDDPANDGIDVITMSWSPDDGTDGSDPICQAATEAVEAGIVVLGSAGNSGETGEPDLGCPTGADGAISVANIWNKRTVDRADDNIRETSTLGPRTDDGDDDPYEELKPDVASPGHLVVSTGASLTDGTEFKVACFGSDDTSTPFVTINLPLPYQCEESFGGTSAATPMTAGVVALMLDANPELTPAGVNSILHQTAEPHRNMTASAPGLSARWHNQYGYGMIDAYLATTMAEQWPGLELGRDRDADGVRDVLDAAPTDPRVNRLDRPADLEPVGGQIDTDGDMVVDADDPAPLDPFSPRFEDARPADAGGGLLPGPGLPAVLTVVAGLAVAWRRRR